MKKQQKKPLATRIDQLSKIVQQKIEIPDELYRRQRGENDDEHDLAQQALAQYVALGPLEIARDVIRQAWAALKRIEKKKYGICEDCESEISESRLDAVPYARLCTSCQEREANRLGMPQPEPLIPAHA
jgi:DnaK suppressor protein